MSERCGRVGVSPRRRSLLLAALGFLGVWMSSACLAATDGSSSSASPLSPDQIAAVREIDAYYNGVKTLRGEFVQVGPQGHVSTGAFHIRKPGKVRFEYYPPNPYEIIADGTWVMVRNRRTGVSDYYPQAATPLHLIVAEDIDLLRDARVLGVRENRGVTSVAMRDRGSLFPGRLIVSYDPRKRALQQWVVVDGSDRRTTVSLFRQREGEVGDDSLFFVPPQSRRGGAGDRR